MLATWRKPGRYIACSGLGTFSPAMAVFAAVMVMLEMTVPQPVHGGVSTDLPKIRRTISLPHAMREDAMTVMIMRNGDVFFGNDRVSPDPLADGIRNEVERGPEHKVYIRADARTLYLNVKRVLDAVQEAGLMNVSFFAEEKGRALGRH